MKILLHIIICFFAILLSGGAIAAGSVAPVEIKQNYTGFIGLQTEVYIDESNALNYAEIDELYDNGNFSPVSKDVYANSDVSASYWFAFSIKSSINEAIWLNVGNSHLKELVIYKTDLGGNLLTEYHAGSLYEDAVLFTDSYTFWFPLIEEGDTSTYQYFIAAEGLLTMEVPLELGTFFELSKKQNKSYYLALFFLGAMVIMLIYNLVLFFFTRDKIYAYYSFCILTIMFGTTFLNNYPILEGILGKNITYNYVACWMWTNFLGIGMFAIEYLKIKDRSPKLYKLVVVELIIIGLYAPVNLFFPPESLSLSFQIFVVVFYLTCLYTAYYFVIYLKDKRAILYSIGWTMVMLGGFLYMAIINGLFPYNWLTRNIMYFGVMVEILVFSIALARRLNWLSAEKDRLNEDLAQVNKELKQNNDSLDSFNYHVSHDLKTVLNNARALTLMAEKYNAQKNNEKLKEILQKLRNVNDNGVETVQSFLSLGQVDTMFNEENLDYLPLANEIYEIVERHNLSERIEVTIKKDNVGSIRIHKKALESIFLNLFTNTIKYNEKAPKAELFFLQEDGHLILKYTDNGIGIDMDQYGEDLFKPFQRANPGTDKEGNGVGLYLIKRIVNNYKGEIEVRSKLEQGTTFIIRLPKTR